MVQPVAPPHVLLDPCIMLFRVYEHIFQKLLKVSLLLVEFLLYLRQHEISVDLHQTLQLLLPENLDKQLICSLKVTNSRVHNQDQVQKTICVLFQGVLNQLFNVFFYFLRIYLQSFLYDGSFVVHFNASVLARSSQHLLGDLHEELTVVAIECQFSCIEVLFFVSVLFKHNLLLLLNFSLLQNPAPSLFSTIHPYLVDGIVCACCDLAFPVLVLSDFKGPNLAFVLVVAERSLFSDIPELEDTVN